MFIVPFPAVPTLLLLNILNNPPAPTVNVIVLVPFVCTVVPVLTPILTALTAGTVNVVVIGPPDWLLKLMVPPLSMFKVPPVLMAKLPPEVLKVADEDPGPLMVMPLPLSVITTLLVPEISWFMPEASDRVDALI